MQKTKFFNIFVISLFILLFFPHISFSSVEKVNNKIVLDEETFNLLVKDAKLKEIYQEQVNELQLAIEKLNKNRDSLNKLALDNENLLNKKIELQNDIITEYKGQKEKYKQIEDELNKDIKKLKRKKITADILVSILAGTSIAVSEKSGEQIAIGAATVLYFALTNN